MEALQLALWAKNSAIVVVYKAIMELIANK